MWRCKVVWGRSSGGDCNVSNWFDLTWDWEIIYYDLRRQVAIEIIRDPWTVSSLAMLSVDISYACNWVLWPWFLGVPAPPPRAVVGWSTHASTLVAIWCSPKATAFTPAIPSCSRLHLLLQPRLHPLLHLHGHCTPVWSMRSRWHRSVPRGPPSHGAARLLPPLPPYPAMLHPYRDRGKTWCPSHPPSASRLPLKAFVSSPCVSAQ
jgi:hypothetical protein